MSAWKRRRRRRSSDGPSTTGPTGPAAGWAPSMSVGVAWAAVGDGAEGVAEVASWARRLQGGASQELAHGPVRAAGVRGAPGRVDPLGVLVGGGEHGQGLLSGDEQPDPRHAVCVGLHAEPTGGSGGGPAALGSVGVHGEDGPADPVADPAGRPVVEVRKDGALDGRGLGGRQDSQLVEDDAGVRNAEPTGLERLAGARQGRQHQRLVERAPSGGAVDAQARHQLVGHELRAAGLASQRRRAGEGASPGDEGDPGGHVGLAHGLPRRVLLRGRVEQQDRIAHGTTVGPTTDSFRSRGSALGRDWIRQWIDLGRSSEHCTLATS